MTLGEFIKQYREETGMSMREFARKADLSNAYVSMLEKGIDGRGNKIVPTIETINKVAMACGKEFKAVFDTLDFDYKIKVNTHQEPDLMVDLDNGEKLLIEFYRKATPERQKIAMEILKQKGE